MAYHGPMTTVADFPHRVLASLTPAPFQIERVDRAKRLSTRPRWMSPSGQTRKSGDAITTSVLPPTAGIPESGCDVRKVPLTDMGRPSSITSLARPMAPLNSDESVFALHASADLPKLHSAPWGSR